MERTIKQILNDSQADGRIYTHGSMGNRMGTYQMTNKTREEFFSIYTKSINSDDREIIEMGLGECTKIHNAIPVLVDLDIKVDKNEIAYSEDELDTKNILLNESGKLYDEEQVEETITVYQIVLKRIISDCKDKDLTCVLLEKNPYEVTKGNTTYFKNGFHLQFPYIFLDKKAQKDYLIPMVKEEMTRRNIFSNITVDSASLVDDGYLNSTWLLYGSSKGVNMDSYKITRVYDSDCEYTANLQKVFKNYNIYDSKERIIKMDDVNDYLPQILSIIPHHREPKNLNKNVVSPFKKNMSEEKTKKIITMETSKKIETAKKLMKLVSISRSEDHNEWMTVGWSLYNLGEGCIDCLDLWIEFTLKTEEQTGRGEDRCIYEWGIMKRNEGYSYTLGTLHYFASQDSPEDYVKLKEENSKKYIEKSIDGSHTDLAKVLYSEFGNHFVCASIESKNWFKFNGNVWEHIESGVDLRRKISDELPNRYQEVYSSFFKSLMEAEKNGNKGEAAMWEKRIKLVSGLIKNLGSTPFKNNVMREATDEFYDSRFKEKLDLNPYIIAFKNGVYDLNNNVFRKGRPEDFLSKTLGVDYREYDLKDDDIIEVMQFIERIFPDPSLMKYFLDMASDVFVGGNHQKKVYFWLGEGDNGKSMLQLLMEYMMGKQLSIKFDTNLITGKKPSQGQAHAELARAGGGVRWAVLEEPNKDEQINIGVMKKLSGNDSFWARDLFEKGKDTREIQPLFKLVFICNRLPNLRHSDKATWNRIRVLPFESTFMNPKDKEIPETYEERLIQKKFPKDLDLEKKLKRMAEPFAYILLNHRLNITNRDEPEKVLIATNLYRKQTDLYRQFIEENIVQDPTKTITLTCIYDVFKDWFKQSFPGQQVSSKPDVQEYFESLWGNCESSVKKWTGYRLRSRNDDITNGEVILLANDNSKAIETNTSSDISYTVDEEGNELPF